MDLKLMSVEFIEGGKKNCQKKIQFKPSKCNLNVKKALNYIDT